MLANTWNRSHLCKGCLFLSVTGVIVTTPGLIVALIGEAHSEGKRVPRVILTFRIERKIL